MRSLIILEVEHGDDTDDIQGYVECVGRYMEKDSERMLTLLGYTVRVDVPECFVLDTADPEVCDNCGAVEGTDVYDNFHDSQNCWRN